MNTEPSVTKSSFAVPETRGLIRSHAEVGALFKIFIVNVLLTVLTLGIYRFWAKTRLRTYLWGNVEIMGDRLEYGGTGKELFIGFLVVFFVILLPLFGGIAFVDKMLVDTNEELRAVLGVVQLLAIIFLFGVALFRARRYRLTRTQWRGIYGAQSGSSVKYGAMALASYLASIFSIGLAWPVCSVWLKRYVMAHTWVGDEQPEFNPSVKKLYGPFMVFWGLGMAYLVTVGVISLGMSGEMGGSTTPSPEDINKMIGGILVIYLSIIPFILGFMWYRGKAYHHFVSSTRFHGHDMSSSITGFRYMRLMVGNALLMIFTLGLATPLTYKRHLNFVERHIGLVGDGDFSQLLQSSQEKPTYGEGLADAFDVGGI